jgi:hypothetical protein
LVVGRKKTTILINVVRFANKNYRMIINSITDFMKKNTPNLILELLSNLIYIQRLLTLTAKRVSIVIPFTFFCTAISAQNSNTTSPIVEVKSYISSLRTLEQNSNSTYSNAQNLEDLLYTVQPSIYFFSGNMKLFGEKPKNLYTEIPSLNRISGVGLLKKNIEIVIIKIDSNNDLNSIIDLNVFSNFYKLKYIYILSSIDITEQDLSKMILNYDEQYSIFYKIGKGE